jgi:superfamily II DNA or RNA helicase
MEVTNEVSAEALARLRTHFGHRENREGQEQIVGAVRGGHDVLAVMPTGSGKAWTGDLDAPFEFEPDFSSGFDTPDE